MNDTTSKCKCSKTVRTIEVTTYTYDPECLAKLMKKNNSNLPQHCNTIIDDCQPPRSVLGQRFWSPNFLKNLFSSKGGMNNDKSKYEVKPLVLSAPQAVDDPKKVIGLETMKAISGESFKNKKIIVNDKTVDKNLRYMKYLEKKND